MKRISVGILAAAALLAVSCSKKAVGPEVEVIAEVAWISNLWKKTIYSRPRLP